MMCDKRQVVSPVPTANGMEVYTWTSSISFDAHISCDKMLYYCPIGDGAARQTVTTNQTNLRDSEFHLVAR
eukprot:3093403-Amphidinium_carterae.1